MIIRRLGSTPPAARIARVRDLNVITMSELAAWAGISRGRLYELLAQADRER